MKKEWKWSIFLIAILLTPLITVNSCNSQGSLQPTVSPEYVYEGVPSDITVTVTDGVNPVQNSFVHIHGAGVYDEGYTDQNGQVTFSVTPQWSGDNIDVYSENGWKDEVSVIDESSSMVKVIINDINDDPLSWMRVFYFQGEWERGEVNTDYDNIVKIPLENGDWTLLVVGNNYCMYKSVNVSENTIVEFDASQMDLAEVNANGYDKNGTLIDGELLRLRPPSVVPYWWNLEIISRYETMNPIYVTKDLYDISFEKCPYEEKNENYVFFEENADLTYSRTVDLNLPDNTGTVFFQTKKNGQPVNGRTDPEIYYSGGEGLPWEHLMISQIPYDSQGKNVYLSAEEYYMLFQIDLPDAENNIWWYRFYDNLPTYTITKDSYREIIFNAGDLSSEVVTERDTYEQDEDVRIQLEVQDSYNQGLTQIIVDNEMEGQWYIEPQLTIYDPNNEVILEDEIGWSTWDCYWWHIPEDAKPGTYAIHIEYDTGPYQGVLVAEKEITVEAPPQPFTLEMDVKTLPYYVYPGDSVTIKCQPIIEATSIQAEIENPDENVLVTLTLYDDGMHNDDDAGDNIYGNTWTPQTIDTEYLVDIIADGKIYDNIDSFTTNPEDLKVTLIAPTGNKVRELYSEWIAKNIQKIGIKADYEKMSFGDLGAREFGNIDGKTYDEGGFDIGFFGWGGSIDPDPHWVFHSSQYIPTGGNITWWYNKSSDELLANARMELNQETRKDLLYEWQEIEHTEKPYCIIYYPKHVYPMQPSVEGFDPLMWKLNYSTLMLDLPGKDSVIYATISRGLNDILFDGCSNNRYYRFQIFETLWKRDENLELVPNLIDHYTEGPTVQWGPGTEREIEGLDHVIEFPEYFDLTIKSGVLFHDGEEMVAEDVKWSMDVYDSPDIGLGSGQWYDDPEILSTYTVRLYVQQPHATWLMYCNVLILPKHVYDYLPLTGEGAANAWMESDLNRGINVIGSGPYKFKEWEPENYILLERNDQYWGMGPNLQQFKMEVLDRETAKQRLIDGTVDIVDCYYGWLKTDIDDFIQNGISLPEVISYDYQHMHFNFMHPLLRDNAIRQAFSHLIDRQGIIDGLLGGYGYPGTVPIAYDSWAFDHSILPDEYNIELARQAILNAGYKIIDLTSKSSEITADPINDHIELKINIWNYGTIPASNISIEFYEGDPNGTLIGMDTIASIQPGTYQEAKVNWTPTGGGSYTIYVKIDPQDTVSETDEQNNVISAGVELQSVSTTNNVGYAQSQNAELEIHTTTEVTDETVTIIESGETEHADASLPGLGKYVVIEASPTLDQELDYVAVKLYYTDEEVQEAGLVEENLKLYYWDEESQQWEVVPGSGVNTIENYVYGKLYHFSLYGVFETFDADKDGVPDSIDKCPYVNPEGLDADKDGCIDTLEGLRTIIESSDIQEGIQNSLLSKVENAEKEFDKGNTKAGINKLEAAINEIEAQKGKKISEDLGELLISYTENIITFYEGF